MQYKLEKVHFELKKRCMLPDLSFLFCVTGILLPKLFWPIARKSCSSDWEQILKFEAKGREFVKILRSLKQFVRTVKGQNNLWQQNAFLTCSWRFLRSNKLEQLKLKLETNIGIQKHAGKVFCNCTLYPIFLAPFRVLLRK